MAAGDLFRIEELERLIITYDDSYRNAEPLINDAEFDLLWDELKSLDSKNPLLQKIGKDSATNFPKAAHIMPMGSQDKAANPEEFSKWFTKQISQKQVLDSSNETDDVFLVEYKLDGASIELQYENGIFVKAVTRGDGIIGDDITQNAKKMQGVVFTLKETNQDTLWGLTGAVRGEVIMTHSVHDTYFADKANCRNAANGLMKRKDGEGSEYLHIMCYDAFFPNTAHLPFDDEIKKIQWIEKQGFKTAPIKICRTAQEVIEYRSHIMDIRSSLDYDIDGLVIKNPVIDEEDMRRPRPEKQIAFKFTLEEGVSIIRRVEWSESGATYTPIAEFDAVQLAGTTVQRANLSNPNTISALNLKIGSKVIVTKRGEIIPKIESLIENPDDVQDIEQPTQCASCNTLLVDEGTRLYCPNPLCPKRIHHRLEKWISVLDVRDFGIGLIKRLFDLGRVKSVSDLYTLSVEELCELERMGEKSAVKVLKSLESKRSVSLERFIAGFDIDGIGETLVAKLVESGFTSLDSLFSATEDDIAAVNGFGLITAKTLTSGLLEMKNEMLQLTRSGEDPKIPLIIITEKKRDGILKDLSFCFTGELYTMKRADAEILVKKGGGSIKTSVVKNLSYLVTNDTSSASSKNKKAAELGIPIINEEEFIKLMEGIS